ncbi:MAG: SEL1-like repeat protein [Bacteroidaceae bacterium]|nr:SEL1-like repeat protein [Bacteroidaceae bacterium]
MKATYDDLRKAIRTRQDPQAFLQLGICYARGIGTSRNHALASYFYEKARALGCAEAAAYLDEEYDLGTRHIALEIRAAFESSETVPTAAMERFRRRLESERRQHNYGIIFQIRDLLPHFYPTYNEEKAMNDVLHGRDTVDADLFYATGTEDNNWEISIVALEHFLLQLYAPVIQDPAFAQIPKEGDLTTLLSNDEKELLHCIDKLTNMYDSLCSAYGINPQEIQRVPDLLSIPYIHVPNLILLRRQAFRCLLSLQQVDPQSLDTYLSERTNDMRLLEICERVLDRDLQAFLIFFVELNVDINLVEEQYHKLLTAFRENRLDQLARHLNDYANRLTAMGIEHQLPAFTLESLRIHLT